jgi:hypothetical protein
MIEYSIVNKEELYDQRKKLLLQACAFQYKIGHKVTPAILN